MQGTGIFWEKDWGFINAESYYAHTVPIIHRYIELCRQDEIYLKLVQNGALRHAAGDARTELHEGGIEVIFQPAFSPDLIAGSPPISLSLIVGRSKCDVEASVTWKQV